MARKKPIEHLPCVLFLLRLAAGVGTVLVGHRVCGGQPPATPLVKSVRDLGFQFRKNDINVTGKDGATSTPLPDGSAFWIFGDTMEGPFQSIRDHVLTDVLPNTACIVPDQDASEGILRFEDLKSADGRRPRQLIHFAEHEDKSKQRLWGVDSICIGDKIYVFYHKITMRPKTSVFDMFDLNGMGIAKATIGEFNFERLRAPDATYEFWKGDQPSYGVCVQSLDDGYVYLWGSLMTGMYLARVRPADIERLDQYEYLVAGPTSHPASTLPEWGDAFNPQATLFDNVPNEMSVSFNPYLNSYLAVHMLNLENKLVLRTAPSIVGPWSEPEVIHRPEKHDPIMSFYAGKEHPELAKQDGKVIFLTFVDSINYMPRLLEVTIR